MKHMLRATVMASVLLLGAAILHAQTTDYFAEYPGGFIDAHYEITTGALANPISLGWVVESTDNDELIVTTTNSLRAQPQDLELGVLNGIAEAQLIIQSEPVRALLENPRSLIPNATFIVPGGAQFETASRDSILGVDVICGLLTTPSEPEERTLLAITTDPSLPFPPLIIKERLGETPAELTELDLCTSVQPLLNTNSQFSVEFRLELTELERRE